MSSRTLSRTPEFISDLHDAFTQITIDIFRMIKLNIDLIRSLGQYKKNQVLMSGYKKISVRCTDEDAVRSIMEAVNACKVTESIPFEMSLSNGTNICPLRRAHNNQYYITTNQSVTIPMQHKMHVMIDGIAFQVIDPRVKPSDEENDHVCESSAPIPAGAGGGPANRVHTVAVALPKGTAYYVNDETKDSVGIPQAMQVESMFQVEPGSQAYLPKGTIVSTTGCYKVRMILSESITVTI